MRTWIVGIDGSEHSQHALQWAVNQAQGRDVTIRAIGAWQVPVVGGGWTMVIPDFSEVETANFASVSRQVQDVAASGVTVVPESVQGHPANTLIDAAEDAALLVVGGRGLGRVQGALLGSVSHRCVNRATAPVAVVPESAGLDTVRRVLVGFDQSDHATHALRWALEFVGDDAEVTAVGAFDAAPWLSHDVARQRFGAEIDQAEADFSAAIGALDPDSRVTPKFVLGDPRVALTDADDGMDLVVMGARGRGVIGAALLGSTTSWMLHNAHTTIVVVR